MQQKRITIRLSEAEYKTVQTRAAAAGASIAETVRALAVGSGSSGQTEAFIEAFAALATRLESLETAPTATAGSEQFGEIIAGLHQQEKAILALAGAVEKLQNARGYGAAAGSVNDPRSDEAWARTGAVKTPPPTPSAPLKPVPGRPDWSAWLQSQPFAFEGETATARMLRVRKIYEQQYGPV
ncbi:hypothetical protein [Azonexus hydrophilus]|uniref:Ribbon-helix-helix protein CopG domain-containing protein n=1 Tax=Azonexus hydrophilus TaxID=418702 RepID=A0ABZ2XFD6_9RHOO